MFGALVDRLPAVAVVALWAVPIGLSAFLLFAVELLVGRLVLPVFGGVPAVWATVLLFFQAALLLGYLYGHFSVARLGPRRGTLVHVVLLGLAVGVLLVAPTSYRSLLHRDVPAVLDLLAMLAITVGVPTFAMTATTPLLSAWFVELAGRGSRERLDPYPLYACSNAGSLLALLVYPLVLEPLFALSALRLAWVVGFIVLSLLLAFCGLLVSASSKPARSVGEAATAESDIGSVAALSRSRVATWLLWSAVPSGLLLAVTNFITTDLISAPLIWVGPLAVYLLSFVVVFSPRASRLVRPATIVAPAAITLLWVPFGSVGGWPVLPLVVLELTALCVVAVALHGRLAADRPPASGLTAFYLVLSAGGVMGGAFVAVVAPLIFPGIWEYPLLLVAALAGLAVGVARRSAAARRPFVRLVAGAPARLGPFLVVAVITIVVLTLDRSIALQAAVRWFIVGGLVLLVGAHLRFLALSTGLVLALAVLVLSPPTIFQARSFFGVVQVLRPSSQDVTVLMNGTTVHGVQWRAADRQSVPASYYVRSGPAGDVFRAVDAAAFSRSVGVVGLGAGGLAAYDRPADRFTFFEIDPVVIRVASDPTLFTYLSRASQPPSIVLGDARLSIEAVPSATYDLLILDAFSSDAVPVHLLTAEALTDDIRVLRANGTLTAHLSNRYYDLVPAVAAALRGLGLEPLVREYTPSAPEAGDGAVPSRWLAATRDPAVRTSLLAAGWRDAPLGGAALTDDHPDILRLLRISF